MIMQMRKNQLKGITQATIVKDLMDIQEVVKNMTILKLKYLKHREQYNENLGGYDKQGASRANYKRY